MFKDKNQSILLSTLKSHLCTILIQQMVNCTDFCLTVPLFSSTLLSRLLLPSLLALIIFNLLPVPLQQMMFLPPCLVFFVVTFVIIRVHILFRTHSSYYNTTTTSTFFPLCHYSGHANNPTYRIISSPYFDQRNYSHLIHLQIVQSTSESHCSLLP